MSVESPGRHDSEQLRAAYERADGDIQTVAAEFPATSKEAIRKALVRRGIHEPREYTSYVTLLEEMTVDEFDEHLANRGEDE